VSVYDRSDHLFKVAIIALLALIYFSSLFGWGHLLEKFLRLSWPFPLTICLGLSGWIFLGGVLNLLGIAYPLVLDGVIIFGLGYFALTFVRSWNLKKLSEYTSSFYSKDVLLRFLPSTLAILIVFVFLAHTVSSPQAFNYHDDFEKYLSHPIRMLATGSVNGSAFSALGSETLGGQAFLQGFALAHWPIGYVNTVDTVFGFLLCLMAVLSVSMRTKLPFWYIPLVVLVPIFINPQYVNISSLYTASAIMIFLFLGPWMNLEEDKDTLLSWPFLTLLGLSYSALIALKTFYLLVVIIHFVLVFLGIIYLSHSTRIAMKWGMRAALCTLLFTSPWILLYRSNWLAWLSSYIIGPQAYPLDSGFARQTAPAINLLSSEKLFFGFGTTFAHYTATMIVVTLCCLSLFVYKTAGEPKHSARKVMGFAACATAPILYVVSIFMITPILTGPDNSLRYLCPVIIAAVPCSLIIAATVISESMGLKKTDNQSSKIPLLIFALFAAGLVVIFYKSLAERAGQAYRFGSTLSFTELARDPLYLDYNEYALSPDAKKYIQEAQLVVPAGKKLVAWTPLAMHLDYRRNRILDIDPAGLANPWLDFPFGGQVSEGIKYFINLDAHYVLWQNRSSAMRPKEVLLQWATSPYARAHTMGVRTYQFVKTLRGMARDSKILYDNGSILVMEISSVK
jgi:hypothetical protein